MTRNFILASVSASLLALGACATTPEPEPIVEPPVVVEVPPVLTCTPISQLERKVIPAEVKRGFSSTSVESDPEFYTDPETGEVRQITSTSQEVQVPYEIVIKPEVVYYVNAQGIVVDDICEVGEGEVSGEADGAL